MSEKEKDELSVMDDLEGLYYFLDKVWYQESSGTGMGVELDDLIFKYSESRWTEWKWDDHIAEGFCRGVGLIYNWMIMKKRPPWMTEEKWKEVVKE